MADAETTGYNPFAVSNMSSDYITKDLTDVYSRFAKEGAKFHIGMIYSTQSPSTISKELLVQTENFFIGHLSSIEEASALSKLQIAYSGIETDILKSHANVLSTDNVTLVLSLIIVGEL